MNAQCRSFRRLLERALESTRDDSQRDLAARDVSQDAELGAFAAPRAFGALSWHAHLTACAECRALLEAEESLEILLATLPEPKLPARLVRRVLARLRQQETAAQDRLDLVLALDAEDSAPAGLARRILQGLAAERAQPVAASTDDAQIDRLLQTQRAAPAPSGLPGRVLAGLAEERQLSLEQRRLGERVLDRVLGTDAGLDAPHDIGARVLRGLATERRRVATGSTANRAARPAANSAARPAAHILRPARVLLALAAAAVASLAAWALWPRSTAKDGGQFVKNRTEAARTDVPELVRDAAPDSQMLASLDVLEQWDMLNGDDVDLLLSTLPTADEALLEFQDTNDSSGKDKEPERPSKG